ncbi:MAG: CotH kinase family protein [Lutibacter sp.]|uniref:CotH kinase family protein n=1 Tax=Lutibacter sp. TaxID=1925666 RepID=UPI00182ADB2F|nr:CotH kinase family protein [Lutibacter sp.]MBT8318193.1 CotH kinase family protein [Lutibacter sp.]NNJ59053.1 CotH kinase family protein [Lutibacter sp.]
MKTSILKISTIVSMLFLVGYLFISCSDDDSISETEVVNTDTDVEVIDSDFVATDWTTETHSKDADPNFTEVFDDTAVKRLDFVISENNWAAMLADMTDLYGTFGRSSGSFNSDDEDPIFVPASVFYKGIEWYKVGLRFKGNSSLASAWGSGILKLSFKMDFDEFEDDYPQIDNQRFYGFKKFSLKNNYDDSSFLREKVAAEVFQNAGLAVSNTSFYTLYVDYGDGPQYFGLYTLVEEVDGTVLDTQFSSDDGNLYKPEDYGSSFAEGTFNEDGFEKKTNEDEADWSDIESVFTALHSDTRITDPETWRAGLDAVFDTDVFLNYLAVNTIIQNWDTYGVMEHNYYLYNNPDNSLLTWIPWDNNEALQDGKMGGSLNLNFSDLSGDWPLIEYLYEDDVYKAKYNEYVQATIDGPFETSYIQGVYDTYAALVEPYATTEVSGFTFLNSSSSFYSAITTLKSHASSRSTAVNNYLN